MRRNQLRQPQCCFGHCSPLVVGGERSSVSPQVIKAADAAVAIPMLGMANSLNVATAAAILLYWLSLRSEEIRGRDLL
jgi:tRNA G18 (ribose-2'-O)-methylase SpoU